MLLPPFFLTVTFEACPISVRSVDPAGQLHQGLRTHKNITSFCMKLN